MKQTRYRHDLIKELWRNRPWVYIPSVVRFMREYPLTKKSKLGTWLRNCIYVNWQVCLVEDRSKK